MKNLSPKTKKILLIAMVLIGLFLLYSFFKNKDEETEVAVSDSGSGLSADEQKYLTPGTSLAGSNTENEALILQQRYAGMSREAILADYIKYAFDANPGTLEFLQGKATEQGKTLAQVKTEDAAYLLWKFGVAGF